MTKVAKLHFLESTLTRLKQDRSDIRRTIQLEKTAFEIFKKFTFSRTFFLLKKKAQILILRLLKNMGKGFLLLRNSSKTGHLLRSYG